MTNKTIDLAEAYFKALGEKNISKMAPFLHPDVNFSGPTAQLSGKESLLETVQVLFPLFDRLTVRAKFGNEDQAMIVYELEGVLAAGFFHAAALVTFEEGLIRRIELFYDPSPLN